jgi:general secretion pathway protein G
MAEMSQDSTGCGRWKRWVIHPWPQAVRVLIVVVLLGVGLIVIVQLRDVVDQGQWRHRRVSTTKASLKQLHTAVVRFHMDNGRWPTQAEGLSALVKRPPDLINWPPGGYLEMTEVPKDEWGRDYIYVLDPGDGRPFLIKSLGADGVEGGEEYDQDMLSVDIP